jgi:hypothetical protein
MKLNITEGTHAVYLVIEAPKTLLISNALIEATWKECLGNEYYTEDQYDAWLKDFVSDSIQEEMWEAWDKVTKAIDNSTCTYYDKDCGGGDAVEFEVVT